MCAGHSLMVTTGFLLKELAHEYNVAVVVTFPLMLSISSLCSAVSYPFSSLAVISFRNCMRGFYHPIPTIHVKKLCTKLQPKWEKGFQNKILMSGVGTMVHANVGKHTYASPRQSQKQRK